MKKSFRLQAFYLVLILSMLASSLQAAEYFVVIGTFAEESNARKFTSEVRSVFKEASYAFNEARNLYYVHVLKTTRKEEARNWSLYLKNEKGFKDAWVLSNDGDAEQVTNATVTRGMLGEPRYSQEVKSVDRQGPVLASSASGGNFTAYKETTAEDNYAAEMAWTNQSGIGYIADVKLYHANQAKFPLASGHLFKFIVEDNQGRAIPSEVMLVDFEKIKKIASFKNGGHAAIRGTRPNQMVTLVCDVLGFKPVTRMYNIDHLSRGRDVRKNKDGIWEVRFKLEKMEVNEFSFLNRTSFYEDAAVLQPSSEKEVDELLAFMQSNPAYKIIIHSHCNPGGSREIRIPAGQSFFDLSGSSSRYASDKRLTKERAVTLRKYLVAHGINKKRIGVIGWGSLELLAGSTAADAEINERIEIELVDNGE